MTTIMSNALDINHSKRQIPATFDVRTRDGRQAQILQLGPACADAGTCVVVLYASDAMRCDSEGMRAHAHRADSAAVYRAVSNLRSPRLVARPVARRAPSRPKGQDRGRRRVGSAD